MPIVKQVVEIDQEFLNQLFSKIEGMASSLQALKIQPQEEFITREQFMDRVKIRKTKFYSILNTGKLVTRKVGPKVYVKADQVARYFDGEFQSND